MQEGEAVGRWLGVVSRAVVGAVSGEGEGGRKRERGESRDGVRREEEEDEDGGKEDVGDWNVVQNNGACFVLLLLSIYLSIYLCTRTQHPGARNSFSQ